MLRKLLKIIIPLLVPAFAAMASHPQAEILFFDGFDTADSIPDPSVWRLCTQSHTAWGKFFGNTDGYSNVKVENGYLVLTAAICDGRYTTGGIRTIEGFPSGTLLEVKASLQTVKGGFPAIWQMPVKGERWPMSGEVDLMEWVQQTPRSVYQTVHTEYLRLSTGQTGHTRLTNDFDAAEEHIYGAARTDEAVIFYIDGIETARYENLHLDGQEGALQFPFTLWDYDIILNYSLGGLFDGKPTWAGPIDDAQLPARMYIDWVKVSRTEPRSEE